MSSTDIRIQAIMNELAFLDAQRNNELYDISIPLNERRAHAKRRIQMRKKLQNKLIELLQKQS